MSKQLTVSATASVLAMALFALVSIFGGSAGPGEAAAGTGLMAAPAAAITR